MASLGLISLVASVLGNLIGLLGAEARVSDTRSMTGLESRTWLTAEPLKGHVGNRETSVAGGYAGGHLRSASGEHPSSIALVDTWKPMDASLWQFFTPPQYHFTHFFGIHGGRQDWKTSENEHGWLGDLTARRQLHPHEFELEFGEYGERVQPQPLFGNVGMSDDAERGARPMWRSPRSNYNSNRSGGGKRRTKRSCVLRRINRFFRRLERLTGRGIVGDLIRAAGGIRGNLQIYRIGPNPAGAQGVGVSFRAGTQNWRGVPEDELSLGAETPGWTGVTRGGRTEAAERTGWNGVARGATPNNNPRAYGNGVDSENIGSVDGYNGE